MRAFVVLAEELHFGRAAVRLGITQSALSQQLRRLEDELGTVLVARTSRATTLTPVGELFLGFAQRANSEVDRGIETVHEAMAGHLARLVIGCLGAGANGPLPNLISAFHKLAPRHAIELHHFPDSATQERGLLTGSLDLAVVRSIANEQAVVAHKLFDEPFVVFVHNDHPLAGRSSVALSELRDEAFVLFPRNVGPSYYELVMQGCQRAGFTPRIEGYGTSLEAQLGLVAAGIGISVQAASNNTIARTGVSMIELDSDDLTSTLWLCHRRWKPNPLVETFLSTRAWKAQGL